LRIAWRIELGQVWIPSRRARQRALKNRFFRLFWSKRTLNVPYATINSSHFANKMTLSLIFKPKMYKNIIKMAKISQIIGILNPLSLSLTRNPVHHVVEKRQSQFINIQYNRL